jgi:hypothetical protein
MKISPEAKQKVQLFLAAAILIAAFRSGYILYERHIEKLEETKRQSAPPLNADYYVIPKKLYPYDLKSARQLTQQPVWVKEGYRYTYYPYDRVSHHSDFGHEAGTLLPLQKLQIKDVVTDLSPSIPDQRQVMAVFEQEGKSYAFPIGAVKGNDYHIFSDEMLFIQDPHELYKHWPADVWASVDKHEVKPGMNELQADFAIGMGTPDRQSDEAVKTVHYPNGGNPLTVTYRDGKAAEIRPGAT